MTATVAPEAPTRRVYSLNETAEMFGVSRRAIEEWRYTNRIKTIKFGRRVMVPAEEIDRLATEGVN